MPTRRRVADVAVLRDFIGEFVQPGLGASPQVLLDLARGPDSVFDLHDNEGRLLVAVLTDLCDNSGDAAELMVIACRSAALVGDELAACLDAALEEARRGPRSSLELVLTSLVRPHRDLLASRGLACRFELISLEQRGSFLPVPPAQGWHWADMGAADEAGVRALSRAAFDGHPGVNFAPPGQGSWVGCSPPVRLLWHGTALAGSVSVRGEADGSGIVEIVQRHPDLAGSGLGPVLLTEALRSLAEKELRPVRLTAAVENRRALALYERFGFVVTDILPVHGVATPG